MNINQPVPSPDDEEMNQEDQFEQDGNEPALEPEPAKSQPAAEQVDEDQRVEESESIPQEPAPVSELEEEITTPQQETEPFVGEEVMPEPPKEESRFVKGFRRVVQWAIIGLLLLAIGGALAYYLTARPARNELITTKAELQSLQEQLDQTESELTAAKSELAGAKDLLQANETTLLASTNRIQFLRVMSNISTARYAIVKKQGATARLALLDAQAELKTILEVVSKTDQELATLLETRLQRAINNLSGDTAVAESDLITLLQDMGQLEDLLFPD